MSLFFFVPLLKVRHFLALKSMLFPNLCVLSRSECLQGLGNSFWLSFDWPADTLCWQELLSNPFKVFDNALGACLKQVFTETQSASWMLVECYHCQNSLDSLIKMSVDYFAQLEYEIFLGRFPLISPENSPIRQFMETMIWCTLWSERLIPINFRKELLLSFPYPWRRFFFPSEFETGECRSQMSSLANVKRKSPILGGINWSCFESQ